MEEEKKTMRKKKPYCKPEMQVEEFSPDQMVCTGCWQVGCETTAANAYEKAHNNGHYNAYQWELESHSSTSCGKTESQVVGANGMWEISTGSKQQAAKGLECTVYTDSTYSIILPYSNIKSGLYIYWTTVSGPRTWHHQGTVSSVKAGHPNMS